MKTYDRILKHLQECGSITSYEAIQLYGCTRLSHYIYLLRMDGYNVASEYVKGKNRYGEKINYCKYKLENSTQKNTMVV